MNVSVIMPVYNAENYLEESIMSVLNQQYEKFELLIVNDGSTDKSEEICNRISSHYSNMKVISTENKGVSSARNTGIDHSKGELIMFIDSDDLYSENSIQIMVDSLRASNADAAFCNMAYKYGDTLINRLSRIPAGNVTVKSIEGILIDDGSMTGILFGSVCTGIYRRNIIELGNIFFPDEIRVNEDGIFNLQYLLKSNLITTITDNLYQYRQLTKKKSQLNTGILKSIDDSTRFIENMNGLKKIDDYDIQMESRKVSVKLWKSLEICSPLNISPFKVKKDLLKNIIKSQCELPADKIRKLGIHKKYYYYVFKSGSVIMVYLSVRYLNPLFRKILRR